MGFYQKYLELLKQGLTIHNRQAREEWRKQVFELRVKSEEEHSDWVKKVEAQWRPGEWKTLEERLNKLTLLGIKDVAHRVGIRFNVDDESVLTKRDYLLVLDEANKKKLFLELKKLEHNPIKIHGLPHTS